MGRRAPNPKAVGGSDVVPVLLGIAWGSAIGFACNALVFRHIVRNRRVGREPLQGIGGVFVTRYLLDLVGLVLFYLVTRNALGLVAAALSITVAVKI
jgi:hypothetical protein